MVVIYYTCPYYLDTAIETIKSIRKSVELHVVIEITPACMSSTVINIDSLEGLKTIETGERVLGKEKWAQFNAYFEGAKSVQFIIQSHPRSFSWNSVKKAMALGKQLKKLHADIIHFDTITTRAIGLYPYIRSKKLYITVHDPLPHSGEASWKENLPNWVFLSWAKGFFFYSEFALKQFRDHFTSIKAPMHAIRFQPVTFLSQYHSKQKPVGKTILFFGRLSVYKGIDILIEAIPQVLEKFPNEKFMIAGAQVPGLAYDRSIVEKYKDNIEVLPRFLDNAELVQFIENAKFVVCPYRDATQSGVLMTALAVGKMVIATNVGSFSEYIKDDVTGLLAEPNKDSIAAKIIEALTGEKYKMIEAKLNRDYSEEVGLNNRNTIINAYQNKSVTNR